MYFVKCELSNQSVGVYLRECFYVFNLETTAVCTCVPMCEQAKRVTFLYMLFFFITFTSDTLLLRFRQRLPIY